MGAPTSNDSGVNTISLPIVGDQNPAPLVEAVGTAYRVVVDNIGPNPILVSYEAGALVTQPAIAKTYFIRSGVDKTFVLQPTQKLFAAGLGAGGEVSVAWSTAIAESFGA